MALTLIRVDIGDNCWETSPCQHDVILYYSDGSEEELRMFGDDIANQYANLLNKNDFEHVQAYMSMEETRHGGNLVSQS